MTRKLYLFLALIVLVHGATEKDEEEDDDGEEEEVPLEEKIHHHKINTRPIIGVLSQKTKPEIETKIKSSNSYIAASYIKWIEAAGGQTVPILNSYTEEHVLKLMSRINGVLIPGGNRDIYDSEYGRVAKIIYKEVIRYNDQGTFYPMWGTCLGFQALCQLAASPPDKKKIRLLVEAKKLMREIDFTPQAFRSRLLSKAPWSLVQAMAKEKLSIHMHNLGILPHQFDTYPALGKMFRPLATGIGGNGVEFVSMIEAKKYPIYGTQFHPEKNQFEWTRSVDFNHDPNAVEASHYFAKYFVDEARKNFHEFDSFEEEEKHMMFNYQMVYSGGVTAFQQVFTFGNHSESYIQ